jgi:CubicO group peptidase (beta-lactamase class C family)
MNRTEVAKVVLCTALLLTPTPAAPQGHPDQRQPSFEHDLRRAIVVSNAPAQRFSLSDRMRRWRVPGLSIAIIDNCQIVDARGFGVTRVNGAEVQADTLFQAASISKPVAAFGALRLVEQGVLNLDADVRGQLRGWMLPDSPLLAGEPVTLRRILSHSAGLGARGYGGYERGAELPTLRQTLDGAPPARPKPVLVEYPPGSDWRYSGGGYLVAQLLMTEATGRPFPDLMHDLVLAPIGMNNSSFEQPRTGANVASGHNANGEMTPGGWHLYPELAAAGLWSTAPDLAALAAAVMRASRSGGVIEASTAAEMLEAEIGPRSLGFVVGGEGRARHFGHDGTNEGYNAMLIAYPETCQGAALMANSDNAKPLMSEILRAVADAYHWPDPMPSTEQEAVAITPDIVARYTGEYKFTDIPDVAPFRIVGNVTDGLTFDRGDGFSEPLLASRQGLFAPDSGVLFTTPDTTAQRAQQITYLRLGASSGADAERVSPP